MDVLLTICFSNDGRQIGARDLTWSYAAYLDAARSRGKHDRKSH